MNIRQASVSVGSWLFVAGGMAGTFFGLIWLVQPASAIITTHSGPVWVLAYLVLLIAAFIAAPVVLLVMRHRVPDDFDRPHERFYMARLCLLCGILEALLGPIIWLATAIIVSGANQNIPHVHLH